ncbi:MAG: hypothetical protein AVO39_10950 [delta proteobacterium MLS_D]|jgi:hypothetical protein|nr:MAG: hypothetical protein AVO39_10950 [delta proteobacterium MLS_D]
MKIKALRNLITKKYGNITKDAVVEVPDELGKAWVKVGAGEQVIEPKAEKPAAPVKEKAVKEPKAEKAVK